MALRWSSFSEKSKDMMVVDKLNLSTARRARHMVSGGLYSGVVGDEECMSVRSLRVRPSRSVHALDPLLPWCWRGMPPPSGLARTGGWMRP